jgi:phosphinothricin acetyltransferase
MNSHKKPLADVTLRDATAGDIAAINDIYNHYVLTCTCTYQEEPDTLEDRTAWFRGHGPGHPVIVAVADSEVAAWGSLSPFHPRSAYRFTVEDSIYVRPGMQGRGIGKAILADLVRRAKALGYRSIVALISADRASSVGLHEKFGFAAVGRLQEVGLKFDRWLDVVYMQKKL